MHPQPTPEARETPEHGLDGPSHLLVMFQTIGAAAEFKQSLIQKLTKAKLRSSGNGTRYTAQPWHSRLLL